MAVKDNKFKLAIIFLSISLIVLFQNCSDIDVVPFKSILRPQGLCSHPSGDYESNTSNYIIFYSDDYTCLNRESPHRTAKFACNNGEWIADVSNPNEVIDDFDFMDNLTEANCDPVEPPLNCPNPLPAFECPPYGAWSNPEGDGCGERSRTCVRSFPDHPDCDAPIENVQTEARNCPVVTEALSIPGTSAPAKHCDGRLETPGDFSELPGCTPERIVPALGEEPPPPAGCFSNQELADLNDPNKGLLVDFTYDPASYNVSNGDLSQTKFNQLKSTEYRNGYLKRNLRYNMAYGGQSCTTAFINSGLGKNEFASMRFVPLENEDGEFGGINQNPGVAGLTLLTLSECPADFGKIEGKHFSKDFRTLKYYGSPGLRQRNSVPRDAGSSVTTAVDKCMALWDSDQGLQPLRWSTKENTGDCKLDAGKTYYVNIVFRSIEKIMIPTCPQYFKIDTDNLSPILIENGFVPTENVQACTFNPYPTRDGCY